MTLVDNLRRLQRPVCLYPVYVQFGHVHVVRHVVRPHPLFKKGFQPYHKWLPLLFVQNSDPHGQGLQYPQSPRYGQWPLSVS